MAPWGGDSTLPLSPPRVRTEGARKPPPLPESIVIFHQLKQVEYMAMLSRMALEQSRWDAALRGQGLSAGHVFAVTNSAVHQMGAPPFIGRPCRQLPPCTHPPLHPAETVTILSTPPLPAVLKTCVVLYVLSTLHCLLKTFPLHPAENLCCVYIRFIHPPLHPAACVVTTF